MHRRALLAARRGRIIRRNDVGVHVEGEESARRSEHDSVVAVGQPEGFDRVVGPELRRGKLAAVAGRASV